MDTKEYALDPHTGEIYQSAEEAHEVVHAIAADSRDAPIPLTDAQAVILQRLPVKERMAELHRLQKAAEKQAEEEAAAFSGTPEPAAEKPHRRRRPSAKKTEAAHSPAADALFSKKTADAHDPNAAHDRRFNP